MYGVMELVFVAIGLVGTIVAAFRFRPSWFAWMAGNLLLFVSTSFLLSTPRYVLTLFPLFVALALATRRTWLLVAVSAISLAGFVYFAGRFATGSLGLLIMGSMRTGPMRRLAPSRCPRWCWRSCSAPCGAPAGSPMDLPDGSPLVAGATGLTAWCWCTTRGGTPPRGPPRRPPSPTRA